MTQRCDFLVLGSGLSGLLCAHKLSALGSVIVLTKKGASDSNTNHAQGGIAAVSYQECRVNAASCLGKIVVWPVTHLAEGVSHDGGDPSRPIRWSNERQVPMTSPKSGPFRAVATVVGVHPRSIELVFMGSPETFYGGTTWTRKFGLEGSPMPTASGKKGAGF